MRIAEIITLITTISTFIGVFFTIKNLKALKYIETITNHRIKNLDVIRNEVAMIVTNIQIALKRSNIVIEDEKIRNGKTPESELNITEYDSFVAPIASIFNGTGQIWTHSDVIIHLNLLKLRVDSIRDNNDVIKNIDYFIQLFADNECIDQCQIACAQKKLNCFFEYSQTLIKSEWEKVETETKGKSFSILRFIKRFFLSKVDKISVLEK